MIMGTFKSRQWISTTMGFRIVSCDIDPAHPRLAFLDTQMARERERIKLSQAAECCERSNEVSEC